jgi:hypothetical protein
LDRGGEEGWGGEGDGFAGAGEADFLAACDIAVQREAAGQRDGLGGGEGGELDRARSSACVGSSGFPTF